MPEIDFDDDELMIVARASRALERAGDLYAEHLGKTDALAQMARGFSALLSEHLDSYATPDFLAKIADILDDEEEVVAHMPHNRETPN